MNGRDDTAQYLFQTLSKARGRYDSFTACCPAHDDKSPSLKVDLVEGRVLVCCFAGCTAGEICAAVGLELADLSPVKSLPARLNGKKRDLPVVTGQFQSSVVSEPLRFGDMRRVEWLWLNMIPASSLTILYGEPATGKTTVALNIAAGMSRGELPDGQSCAPVRSLIWVNEDDRESVILPRLAAAGAVPEMIRLVMGRTELLEDGTVGVVPFNPIIDMPLLIEGAIKTESKLIILDNIADVVGGDSNSNENVRATLTLLGEACRAHGFAIIAIGHTKKSADGVSALNRLMGSRAFGAVARMCLYAIADPQGDDDTPVDNHFRLLVAKSSLGVSGGGFEYRTVGASVEGGHGAVLTSKIAWGEHQPGNVDVVVREIERRREKDREHSEEKPIERALELIRFELRKGAMGRTELLGRAAEVGITKATFERAIKEEKARGLNTWYGANRQARYGYEDENSQ